MKRTTIVIADDHKIFAEGIQSVTREVEWLEWVGVSHTASQTLDMVRKKKPDVLLLDYHLPDGKGVDVAATLLSEMPQLIILMLSMENDNDIIYQCKVAGVKGYLIKNLSSDELLYAIEEAMTGNTVFMWGKEKEPGLKPAGADVLSKREKEIIHWIRQGLTSHEIAEKLFLSTYTVDTHRRNILRKLELKNTAMMVLYAQQHHL